MGLEVEIFRYFEDNYGFLVHDSKTGATASIDAADENAIALILEKRDWVLSDIFITHHHWDHTDAIIPLKKKYGAKVTGPELERDKIKSLDILISGGDKIKLGESEFEIIKTAGHTLGHISYFEPSNKYLFCGDALFSLGCGRMFEGDANIMWEGLERIKKLPDETLIFCGHEYSAANAKFALFVEPDNEKLKIRQAEISKQLANNKFTIPTKLANEKEMNPFLRCDNKKIAEKMGVDKNKSVEVFAALRKAKDVF